MPSRRVPANAGGQVASDFVMGHAAKSNFATYRETVFNEQLAKHVKERLFCRTQRLRQQRFPAKKANFRPTTRPQLAGDSKAAKRCGIHSVKAGPRDAERGTPIARLL